MIPLDKYYSFLVDKYKENTALTYYRTLHKFAEENPNVKTKEEYLLAIREYIKTRKTDNSYNTFISAMRNYFDFKGWHDEPLPNRIPRKSKKKKITAPSKKKMEEFFKTFNLKKDSDLRLYLICLIATYTGITAKKLVQLHIDDELILEMVKESEYLERVYKDYLKIRFVSGYKSNLLFPNKNRYSKTEYMNIQSIYKLIKAFCRDRFEGRMNITYPDFRNYYMKNIESKGFQDSLELFIVY